MIKTTQNSTMSRQPQVAYIVNTHVGFYYDKVLNACLCVTLGVIVFILWIWCVICRYGSLHTLCDLWAVCPIFVLSPIPHAIIVELLACCYNCGWCVEAGRNFVRHFKAFYEFQKYSSQPPQKTLTHSQNQEISEEITQHCIPIRIITLRSSSEPNFEPLWNAPLKV